MIVYDLACAHDHRFEGWFGSSADFEEQHARGLVACPQCGSSDVRKAPMAAAVPKKGNQRQASPAPPQSGSAAQGVSNAPMPPEVAHALNKLAQAQAKALEKSTWVGKDFAEQSRAMHYGERDVAVIHGQTSPEEARALIEEGVPVAPLPFPIAPPDEVN